MKMVEATGPSDDYEPQPKLDIPLQARALQSISYNSIVASDVGTTSSEDEAPDAGVEEVRTAIGISIGQEQTRLTSPKTPAVEKQAAIEQAGGFFGGIDGVVDEENEEQVHEVGPTLEAEEESTSRGLPSEVSTPARSPPKTPVRLPSPWRAEPKTFIKDGKARSGILDGIFSNRRRASSGPDSWYEGLQKSFMSNLPSVPRRFALSSPFASSSVEQQRRPQATDFAKPPPDDMRPPLAPVRSRASQLRRTASDDSLVTHRTLSTVESLGDDSRFEDVQGMVNSRVKAIKDSWADSSIKMPNFRTPEFIRSRSYSLNGPMQQPKPVDPMTRQPYTSAKDAINDAATGVAATHPNFHKAMGQLEGDVVVLGGYRGSILRSAEPPHRQLWVPVKVGLNLRKANLEVGIEEEDDHRAPTNILPGGMLTHIGPVDISRRLFKRLRFCENARTGKLRVHDYGYDWRLNPAYLSQQLIQFLEKLPCNKASVPPQQRGATVIAHSLGGMITRHAINQRPDLVRGVVYAGVPNTCVNILGPLRNGDEVLLSSRVLTAQVNFTIRTSFALLPLDGRCFFDKKTREEYPVDFFDPQTWIDNKLSPCVGRPLPPLTAPPNPSGIYGYVNVMTSALPSLPFSGRKGTAPAKDQFGAIVAGGAAEPNGATFQAGDSANTILSGNIQDPRSPDEPSTSVGTTVTIPREKAIQYLTRTLASVKKFKQELIFNPEQADAYPPAAVIYGKSTPTVYGAKVDGREGIKHADAYDNLAFASGDGVVLAKAAMVPEGYKTARGGVVASDRGHVTLLGDLEAVGKCLLAVGVARRSKESRVSG